MRQILNLLDHGAALTVLPDNNKEYPYYNPSIAYDGAGLLRVAVRSCNFTYPPAGQWFFADGGAAGHAKTIILYGTMDPKTFAISNLVAPVFSSDTPTETKDISGLEDARIFWRQDGMHFIGVQVDTTNKLLKPASLAEYVLNEKQNILQYIRTLDKPNPNRTEKNWQPTNVPGAFDFGYSPLGPWTNGQVDNPNYSGVLHGGTQLLWQPETETWLGVIHDRKQTQTRALGNALRYINYLAEYDKGGVLRRISNPFIFGSGYAIEFASGMVEHGQDLLISVGLQDAMLGMVRMPKAKALDMLHPYRQDLEYTVIPMGSSVGWRSMETLRKAAGLVHAR